MTNSHALLPRWIESKQNQVALNAFVIAGGSVMLGLLAHLTARLPFTPVPITGQTFGVAFLALAWGRARAMSAFALYLIEGFAGLPVFASAAHGPFTYGYLFGMFVACGLVGTLADRGFARSVPTAFLCAVSGSLCVFAFGLLWLARFFPVQSLLDIGLLPFLPGDILKNLVAALLVGTICRFNSN